jgi:hypothetical protein
MKRSLLLLIPCLYALAFAASAAPESSKSAAAPQTTYRSALASYRAFAEQDIEPWREANDRVGAIGGWQAYARETQAPETADRPSTSSGARAMPAEGSAHRHHH